MGGHDLTQSSPQVYWTSGPPFLNCNSQPVGPVRNAWSGRPVEVKAMEISSIPRPPADVSRLHRRERQQQPEMISIIRHAPRLRSVSEFFPG